MVFGLSESCYVKGVVCAGRVVRLLLQVFLVALGRLSRRQQYRMIFRYEEIGAHFSDVPRVRFWSDYQKEQGGQDECGLDHAFVPF